MLTAQGWLVGGSVFWLDTRNIFTGTDAG